MIVQAFWSGEFGTMERMCVQSHINHGHEFFLYTYEPHKVISKFRHTSLFIAPASQIVSQDKMREFPSPSLFSDYFRYVLLARNGGWWCDMDSLVLKSFDSIPETPPHVFASDNIDHFYVSGCFMRAPVGDVMMSTAKAWIDAMTQAERNALGHMDIGPTLLQKYVPKFGLVPCVAPPLWFDPIPWDKITGVVDPNQEFDLSSSYAIHMRQSIWNEGPNSCAGILPDGTKLNTEKKYPEACLWEKLKRELL